MKNGCILYGGTGSGKSRTSLAYYYFKVCQGNLPLNGKGKFKAMTSPKDLYIITTAKKRDSFEWNEECAVFNLSVIKENSKEKVNIVIDSWNNIDKYSKVQNSFFIFDEQRVIGNGQWTKSFYTIARKNEWILLSATPGDRWTDYIPVFIANGFYKNRSEFIRKHVVYNPYIKKYPKIQKFINVRELKQHQDDILIIMDCERATTQKHVITTVTYDRDLYFKVMKDRWDVYDNKPIKEVGKLCYLLRKVINSDKSRIEATELILKDRKKAIIFYNYDYELLALRKMCSNNKIECKEWNGKKHEKVPTGNEWAYLVQYSAGAEGWNCITTDTTIFFSQNYSYRMMAQASGRTDRLNTPYETLYYYHLRSTAPIDLAIEKALKTKENFNEQSFINKLI